MRDFKPGENIVCIHDDFRLYKEGNKPIKGPKKGDIVTFLQYIQDKSYVMIEEHRIDHDGKPVVWNANKFAPLISNGIANQEAIESIKEFAEELELV